MVNPASRNHRTPRPARLAAADDFGTEAQIQAGKFFFTRLCGGCHGDGAIGNALNPDLRYSPMAMDAVAWRRVVIDGVRSENGMISLAEIFSEDDAEAIRA